MFILFSSLFVERSSFSTLKLLFRLRCVWNAFRYHFANGILLRKDPNMRPKSGLPKRKALRNMPLFDGGLRSSTEVAANRKKQNDTQPRKCSTVVSLFAGCGGMDLGFLGGFESLGQYYPSLPFEIVHAFDIDDKAIETYQLNIADHASVADLTVTPAALLPECDVLLGGFPCQDFSSCGPKQGFDGKRGRLYRILVDYMVEHQPKIVVAENVPHLAKLQGGDLLATIVEEFESTGYSFKVWTLYCPDYGLPQHRVRLFFVGVRNDIANACGRPSSPDPSFFSQHRTIDDAIDDLKGVSDETVPNQSQYFVATRASKGAGQGDQVSMKGDVSYAVRANPRGRVHFHYELDRRLTVRECARLQSFPDQFVFPFATSTNMMQIGNAVPPIIAHQVATEVAEYLKRDTKKFAKETVR